MTVRRHAGRLAAVAGATLLLGIGTALPADAHVAVLPASAAPGQFLTYAVTVPNERDDQATVSVDVTLPKGFSLDAAEQVPGWQTVVAKDPAGVPSAVTWQGGRIPVGTYATFGLQGRNPAGGAQLTWVTQQHYENVTVAWDGPDSSEHPAAVVRLLPGGVAGGTAAGPAATAGNGAGSARVDHLARSRAALAIVLAVAGLLAAAATLVRGLRPRPDAGAEVAGTSAPEVDAPPAKAAPVKPAPVKAAPVKAAPVKAAPVKAAPVKAAPVKAAPASGTGGRSR